MQINKSPQEAGFWVEAYRALEFVTETEHDHMCRVVMAIATKAYDVPDLIYSDIIGGVIVLIILNFVI